MCGWCELLLCFIISLHVSVEEEGGGGTGRREDAERKTGEGRARSRAVNQDRLTGV